MKALTPLDGDPREISPMPSDVPPVPPPPLGELPKHLHVLHHHPAPLFTPDSRGGLRRPVKGALNLLLRFVGRSQQTFNEEVREALTLLMAEVRCLRRWGEDLAAELPAYGRSGPLAQEIAALGRRVTHLQACVSAEFVQAGRHRLAKLEHLEADVRDCAEQVEGLATRYGELQRELHGAVRAQVEWTTVLQRKYELLSLEARELVDRDVTPPAPRIVDPEGYARRLGAMGDVVRANVGCGEKPWPDYINVDLRALPDVDVLADAHRLPFEPGSLDELASSHLVEHFREHHFRSRLLPYWKSLLRPGGRLRIVCPNWGAMLERLNDGRMSLDDFKLVTFGAQDYEGDDHFAMYTPDTLRALLLDGRFSKVEVLITERMNGLCPEMELIAHL